MYFISAFSPGNTMGITQSTPEQPSLEQVLKDALKPYTLEDARKYQTCMEQILLQYRMKQKPEDIIKENKDTIEEISKFCKNLGKFGSKEERSNWYRSTYSKPLNRYSGGTSVTWQSLVTTFTLPLLMVRRFKNIFTVSCSLGHVIE